jgi:hypothetical protein
VRAEAANATISSREDEIRMNSQADMPVDQRHLMMAGTVEGCRMHAISATRFSRSDRPRSAISIVDAPIDEQD